MILRISAVVFAATLCGCISDGATGDQGKVRFSQVFNFQETKDFTPPIALNSTMLIKLERPSSGTTLTDPGGFPELTLETKPQAEVLPMGFGEFAISMSSEGSFQLIAKEEGKTLDTLNVTVKAPDHVRFSPKVSVVTSLKSGTTSCVRVDEVALADVVLHKNQSATYFAVAAQKDDSAMLGLLGVTASNSDDVLSLDVPLILEDTQPGGLIVKPKGTLGNDESIKVTEASGLSFTQTVKTANSDADGTCN